VSWKNFKENGGMIMDENEKKYREDLLRQVKNAYGKVVYSYTTHWKQQNIYSTNARRIKIAEIVLNSISTTGLLGFLIFSQWWAALIGTIFSAVSLGLSLYTKEVKYDNLISAHRTTADELWVLRERYVSLMTDFQIMNVEDISKRRDELETESARIYRAAAQTTGKAYEKAQKALKQEEEQFFTNDELNLMLPPHLRS
jgi:hypothetical protein